MTSHTNCSSQTRTSRSRTSPFLWIAIACLAAGLPLFVSAREAEENSKQDNILAQAAAEYSITVDKDRSAELVSKPILSWTNPLRETPDGSLFLWTYRDRPQVAASFYTYGEVNANIDHEFQSLSADALVARRKEKPVWEPSGPGVEFKEVPQAPAPAESEVERLTQMRTIARGFTATVGSNNERHELRLLPQPLYRYPEKDKQVLDGALFAFVQGTDPEVLLLLEARRTKDENRWHYALARMSDCLLDVEHDGASVWKAEPWDWRQRNTQASYIKFTERLKR
jgi:hypothetical protein